MEARLDDFYRRLKRGPAFLLLGQNYLRLESGVDSFLSEVIRKYGGASAEKETYDEILDSGAVSSPESALAWMDDRCRRLSVPRWLKTAASYLWNGVYTSAIDSIWPSCFRTSWREIQPLFEEKYRPSDPRNRSLLHCTFLYGCVNRAEEGERPPLTRFDYRKRKQIAISLARRLPEAITPMGVLAIEGHAGDSDWFSLDDLLPILDELNAGQTHIFSVTQELLEHPDVKELTQKGKLLLHQEGLAETLVRGEGLGLLRLGGPPEGEESGRRIQLDDEVLTVPRDLWNQVSRSAIVLDDALLLQPPPLSDEARYREFRNFLSASDGKPQWSAYARGFAFPRHFEKTLRQAVDKSLGARTLIDDPVILHGQTGTGKTVALAALAYGVRRTGKYPVLFIERKTQRPVQSDIDRFCQWAEHCGAPACLLVWDGMLEPKDYSECLKYHSSRGRKVVLVGSSYRIEDKFAREPRFVLAPPTLNPSEIADFAPFLNMFHPSLGELLRRAEAPPDDSFLVALYRLLPPTRGSIRAGVSREAGHAEELILQRASKIRPEFRQVTALGRALLQAGVITEEQLLTSETKDVGGEAVSEVQDLTGLVMVPGRFGLRVPLELVVRALGKHGYSNFMDLLEGVDILRSFEDSVGNIDVGPRNALEAKLIVQARMGGARTETAFAKRLLLEVTDGGGGFPDSREIDFAVELVRSMGAQGQERAHFAPYFKDLSAALQQLREERGVEHPRLMLQEANLLREWAVDHAKRGEQDVDLEGSFHQVGSVLRRALDLLGDERRNRILRAHLLIELAAATAARARHVLGRPDRSHEAIPLFDEARNAIFEARKQDPSSLYPIDVLEWATEAMLESSVLDERAYAEAVADVLYALQTVEEEDLNLEQQERLHTLRLKFAHFVRMEEMAEEAFAALVAQGSSAGYYLRALRMSGLPETSDDLSDSSSVERLRGALGYLEEHRSHFSRDERCLGLLLDLWWMVQTQSRFFDRERKLLPLSDEQWQHCLGIIHDLEATSTSHRPTSIAFVRGLALFHLGSVQEALEVFREVERESEQVRGRRRVIRSYMASTPSGQPRRFHGDVRWVAEEGNRGEVWVEELRHGIRFLPRDFGRPNIARGDTLGEFHVAFNFLGPIADPPGHLRP